MGSFLSFVKKEALHILRDSRTMLIVLGMPVVQMLLFGFATSVGAVEADLFALKRSCRYGNQVADITVSSCREVLRSSDIFSLCKRDLFHLSV